MKFLTIGLFAIIFLQTNACQRETQMQPPSPAASKTESFKIPASDELQRADLKARELRAELERIKTLKDPLEKIKALNNRIALGEKNSEMALFYLEMGREWQEISNLPQSDQHRIKETGNFPSDWFKYNDYAAESFYNGYHFKKLTDSFPNSEWTDDAAYELILYNSGAEGESELDGLRWFGSPIIQFLKTYKDSNLRQKALDHLMGLYRGINRFDLAMSYEYFGPQSWGPQLDELESFANSQEGELKNELLAELADWWIKMRRFSKAKATLQNLMGGSSEEKFKKKLHSLPAFEVYLKRARFGLMEWEVISLKESPVKITSFDLLCDHKKLVSLGPNETMYARMTSDYKYQQCWVEASSGNSRVASFKLYYVP